MKSRGIAFLALIAFGVILLSTNAAALAGQGKDADLRKQVQELEKRVAELEKQIKQLLAASKQAPRTEMEGKLVGSWVIIDADKKGAWHTDMKLNGDGTCTVAHTGLGSLAGTYQVTGKAIAIRIPHSGAYYTAEFRIASFNDNELVIERDADGNGKVTKFRYTRVK